jgi:hypothetical protein
MFLLQKTSLALQIYFEETTDNNLIKSIEKLSVYTDVRYNYTFPINLIKMLIGINRKFYFYLGINRKNHYQFNGVTRLNYKR